MRFATTRKPVRSIPTTPPAARFLWRERNRGKSAAGEFPCTPGAQGAEAKGGKARRGRSGWVTCRSAADEAAGSARLLFRVPYAAPAQGFDLSRPQAAVSPDKRPPGLPSGCGSRWNDPRKRRMVQGNIISLIHRKRSPFPRGKAGVRIAAAPVICANLRAHRFPSLGSRYFCLKI